MWLLSSIEITIPRQGTKTRFSYLFQDRPSIEITIPRKGTKTGNSKNITNFGVTIEYSAVQEHLV